MTRLLFLKNTLLLLCLLMNINVWASNADIKSIALAIETEGLQGLGLSAAAQAVSEQVVKNLSSQRLPMSSDKAATHRLQVLIGEIHNASTPVGFSFSAGNSDPRALAFQKADVLPIECRLVAQNATTPVAKLAMNFSAKPPISVAQLADNISTVCFDLLDDLPIVTTTPAPSVEVSQPTWFPAVKIETVTPLSPKTETNTEEKTPIVPDEERKQMTIQNQGSPLILKFGHERK